MPQHPDDAYLPLNANGQAYTSRQYRDGIPLSYVAQKLRCGIEDLHRYAQSCPNGCNDLRLAMYYLLAAHLGLHNMLGKANDPALVDRLLDGSSHKLQKWLCLVEREGDVHGVAELES